MLQVQLPKVAAAQAWNKRVQLVLAVNTFKGKPAPHELHGVFNGRGGSIGRASDNHMVLPDPNRQISAKHAGILFRDESYFLVDTSQNGVFLGAHDEPIGWCRTARLSDGDTVRIGDYELDVSIVDTEDRLSELERDLGATLASTRGDLKSAIDALRDASGEPSVPRVGPKVLVVDHEEDVSYLIKFMLERSGCEVTLASDGLIAQKHIESEPPVQLVVLDAMLPYVDGFHLMDQIRAHPLWHKVPIVILSSMASEQDIAQALGSGANDYVAKPFKPIELVARLRRLLE